MNTSTVNFNKTSTQSPILWLDSFDGCEHHNKDFQLRTINDEPLPGFHIVALSSERDTRQMIRKLQAVSGVEDIKIFPAEVGSVMFETTTNVFMRAEHLERWFARYKGKSLSLEESLAIACDLLRDSSITPTQRNIELEELRKRCNVSSFDWNKYIRDLEVEIHAAVDGTTDPDERLRLELKALAKEDDPVKRLRKRSEIASHYRIKASDIEACIRLLDERSKLPEAEAMSLDEFFDLPLDNLDYLIPGMLPQGETILFVAAPKTGKTLLAYDVAFAVATGESKFLGEDCKQGKVLIVQCDESKSTAKGRLIKRGFRREDKESVQIMSSFNMSQLDKLEEKLETFRPALVIIDSLKRINSGRQVSENSAEFADNIYQLKELLSRYNASGILIHHSNKNPEAVGVDKVRGSSAIAGATWGIWDLGHIPKQDPHNKRKLIIDPKDPNRILSIFARDIEGQRLKIELDPENNSWINHGEDGANALEEQERQTLGCQIIELLTSVAPTGLEASEIKTYLGCGDSVYPALNRLQGKRIIGSRPSNTDRRRTVYFMHQEQEKSVATYQSEESNCHNEVHSPPPPTDPIDIEFAETNTEQSVQDTYHFHSTSISDSYQIGTQEEGDMNPSACTASTSEFYINSPQAGGGCVSDPWLDDNCHTGANTQEAMQKVEQASVTAYVTDAITEQLSQDTEPDKEISIAPQILVDDLRKLLWEDWLPWSDVEALMAGLTDTERQQTWALFNEEEKLRINDLKQRKVQPGHTCYYRGDDGLLFRVCRQIPLIVQSIAGDTATVRADSWIEGEVRQIAIADLEVRSRVC